MKTVMIELKINDFKIKKEGTLDKKILYFNNNNVKYQFDIEKLVLKRESEEFLSIIDFKSNINNNFYLLKEYNKEITNNLIIKELQLKKNIVIIRYEIEKEMFDLSLSYKEVEM